MRKFTKLTTHTDEMRNARRHPLADKASGQYAAHQNWLIKEIQKGIIAADRGELLPGYEVENWFQSIGVTS